jgi:hypothetical protein
MIWNDSVWWPSGEHYTAFSFIFSGSYGHLSVCTIVELKASKRLECRKRILSSMRGSVTWAILVERLNDMAWCNDVPSR